MEQDEAAALRAVATHLQRRFPGRSADEIRQAMEESERSFAGRPIRHFVPIFVERDVTALFAPGTEALTDPPGLREAESSLPA